MEIIKEIITKALITGIIIDIIKIILPETIRNKYPKEQQKKENCEK